MEEDSGLLVVDLTNPLTPSLVGFLKLPSGMWEIAIAGDWIFAAGGTEGLHVIDISDPTEPVLMEGLDTPGDASGVAVSGEYVCVCDGASGFGIMQVSNRSFKIDRNIVQSPTENPLGEEVISVRVLPTVTDSIRWDVNGDGGQS